MQYEATAAATCAFVGPEPFVPFVPGLPGAPLGPAHPSLPAQYSTTA